ncbi:HAMP domain-containing histidine kinase [Sphingomonas montanisoli]|uniref:HAMP domain-containing histidine kinase n=1 Tax=Sphingomonas montanisoli TaxID=2606412 RepID=UPI0015E1A7C3|nr:HAMP domain-containing histidine kinase [Sphingomonas montanisoli]
MEYEALLIRNRLDDCARLLSQIQEQFGVSLWLIETRLALIQRTDGLEAQKAFASSIQDARARNDVIAFLAYHLSRRNEPSTTAFRYVQHLQDLMGEWENASDLASYLLFRLANQAPRSPRDFAEVLRYESSAALVDHYETFVRLSAWAGSGVDKAVRQAFNPEVEKLARLIADKRLSRTAFLLSGQADWLDAADLDVVLAEDANLVGDQESAISSLKTILRNRPADASSWLTLARLRACSVNVGQELTPGGIADEIVCQMVSVMSFNDDADAAAAKLLIDILNHRLQGFSPWTAAALWKEAQSPLSGNKSHDAFAFAYGDLIRPSDVSRMPSRTLSQTVANRVAEAAVGSPTLASEAVRANLGMVQVGSLPPELLPPDVLLEAQIDQAMNGEDYEAVLGMADQMPIDTDYMRRRRVSRAVGFSLLQTGQIVELTNLIANSCVADTALARLMPLADCAKRLDRDVRRRMAGDVSVAIVLDLFSQRFDDTLDDVRGYAYEDFLLANGIERPSQLEGHEDEFDRSLLIYYLRNLCVPAVMQMSSAFQGTRELEEERKRVLSLLVKLDPDSAKTYEDELREVTRTQLINRGVRQVERSKIFVDVPAIKRGFEKRHRETFQRYLALSRAGMGADDGEIGKALEEALTGTPLPAKVLYVPDDEASDLLKDMVRWLFSESTNSPEHGLDCYLSMRIRHGTLSGQLRTPVEVENLITQRAAGTDEYEVNRYWADQFGELDVETREAASARLSKFSADYDALISRMASELIQVRSSDKPDGLFSMNLKAVRFRVWIAHINVGVTFDQFFDSAMELFWESVDASLVSVRGMIDGFFKPEVHDLFADLEKDMQGIVQGIAIPDLERAIRSARTAAIQALDIVKDWFRLSQPISEPAFPIGDLIDVGLQCVTAIHHDFNPDVKKDLDPLPPFGNGLTLFSDIFFILFDNVRRHSGKGARPEIAIEVREREDMLHLTARNKVEPQSCSDDAVARVEKIRKAIADGDFERAMRSEGGTGLIKLHMLINRRQSEDGRRKLDFGFDNGEFFVSLEMRVRMKDMEVGR